MGYNCRNILMKKIVNLLLVAFMVFAVVSCKKDKEVDQRDEFVGTYSFTQTGSASLFSQGTIIGTIPMDGAGKLICSKVGITGNQVKLTGDIVANVEGVVSGNTLVLSPTTVTGSSSGYTVQYTINYQPATKNGNTVTCLADVTGTAQGNSNSAIISGKITLVAQKK